MSLIRLLFGADELMDVESFDFLTVASTARGGRFLFHASHLVRRFSSARRWRRVGVNATAVDIASIESLRSPRGRKRPRKAGAADLREPARSHGTDESRLPCVLRYEAVRHALG